MRFCVISYFEVALVQCIQQAWASTVQVPDSQSLLMRFVCFHSSRDCWKTFMVAWLNSWL
jgi:hypothetical protein